MLRSKGEASRGLDTGKGLWATNRAPHDRSSSSPCMGKAVAARGRALPMVAEPTWDVWSLSLIVLS